MAKKIFDIIPPHLISDTGEKVKEFIVGKKPKKKSKKVNFFTRIRIIIIIVIVLVILLGAFLYSALASVEVSIWPKTEDVSLTEKITAENLLSVIDLENKKIPAQFIEEEKELTQEFDATGSGNKEGVASGTIKVYNKYVPATPLNFKTGTRFLSDSGKYFRSVGKVNIPAAQVKNGKVTVPGSVEIKVTAIESGEDYNISGAKFSVPGLAGTAFYYSVYAESVGKMTGGFESTLKIVTAEDIDNAKNTLTEKLYQDIEASIRNSASSSGLVLVEGSLSKTIIEASSSIKAGAEVSKFDYKAKVKIRAIAFKDEDLKSYARQYLLSHILSGRTLLEKSFVVNYSPITIDSSAGKITINLEISGKTYPAVDENELSLRISQKSSDEIKEIVYTALSQEVSQLKIKMWPFWVKEAPKSQKKIKVYLNFD